MPYRSSKAAALCLALGASTLLVPTRAEAQVANRVVPAQVQTQADRAFTLIPQSACLRLSTMQIGSNSQQAMRSGAQNHNSSRSNRTSAIRAEMDRSDTGIGVTTRAQNHNSSRSNRTQPMPRPDIVIGDTDGDGFPDMLGSARIHLVAPIDRGRSAAGAGGPAGPEIRLEIGDPDSDDDAISDLVNATTFRVTHGERGNPLHEASASSSENPMFERAGANDPGPTRTWTYALVPAGGDLDGDGWGDVLQGATVRVSESDGRFHVDLQLADSETRTDTTALLEAPSFSIGKRSARTGR